MNSENFLHKTYTYAIIGASADENKYGYKILKDLHEAGYKVVPVNPKGGSITGLKVCKKISEIEEVDVAVLVVPPAVTEEIVVHCKEKGVNKIWMQPGAASEKAIQYCEENDLACVHDMCIMVEKEKKTQ